VHKAFRKETLHPMVQETAIGPAGIVRLRHAWTGKELG
jgi:hypothetical protein